MASKPRPAILLDTAASPFARLRPVPIDAVNLLDGFWPRRREIIGAKALPFQHQYLESTGRLANLRRAARRVAEPFRGTFFDESDVYKWVEAAYWILADGKAPGLLNKVDAIVGDLRDAQKPDGYLNTYFVQEQAQERWKNLKDMHELYCAGHLIQAGIAGYRAVGDDRLLKIGVRFADHICDRFGTGSGQHRGTGGHPGIEMAMVELYRETHEVRYLDQARFFLDQRGHGQIGGQAYHQDHRPFKELDRLEGHAVRALYLSAGAADLHLENGDPMLLHTLKRLWNRMVARQMYITGGLGALAQGEAFGEDYELPNREAYAESCAAVACLMWSWRMFQIDAQAKYTDLLETLLYNVVSAGVGADGCGFFYRNPLASLGEVGRSAWFSCACCPPNLARAMASLPGMIYSKTKEAVYVNLYISSAVEIPDINGRTVELDLLTNYPWDGEVNIDVKSAGKFAINLRIPGWVDTLSSVSINGALVEKHAPSGEYLKIYRQWEVGDQLQLNLPMEPRTVISHPGVVANQDRVAFQRGPLVYCLEGVDNPAIDPNRFQLFRGTDLKARFKSDFLGGVVILEGEGALEILGGRWVDRLYQNVETGGEAGARESVSWTAIPYSVWANREENWMQVWHRSCRQ